MFVAKVRTHVQLVPSCCCSVVTKPFDWKYWPAE